MAEPDLQTRFREVMQEMAGDDGDLGYMHESLPALTAFAREFAAPDFTCVMAGLPPAPPTTFEGVEGIETAWQDYGSAFEGVRARLVEIRESDDHTVVIVDQQAKTRHGGVEISQPSAMVFAFDGERVRRVEFHLDRAEALRVAGLG
jgi:ketosteroid isomerase-like protein